MYSIYIKKQEEEQEKKRGRGRNRGRKGRGRKKKIKNFAIDYLNNKSLAPDKLIPT